MRLVLKCENLRELVALTHNGIMQEWTSIKLDSDIASMVLKVNDFATRVNQIVVPILN
jgi:hypothetical protein